MRIILVTVGTSLITNAQKALGRQELNEQEIANYLRHTDPKRASAETNSLSRLLEEGDKLVFMHSQTEEGRFCAEALRRHYENEGYRGEVCEIPDLTYTESRFKMRGLRSLVATMVGRIRRGRKEEYRIIINATGGFKAEIAYATLIGLLFDVPVYYIHEAFRDIIQMPPTPISWDYSLLANYEEFFEWVNSHFRTTAEVDSRLQGLADKDKLHLLLVEEEGYTFLSPAGEAFYEAYRERLQEAELIPIWLSSVAYATYQRAKPDQKNLFDRALCKLRLRELRISNSDRVHNSDCLVFPKGHRDERLFYFEGEKGDIYVCELTLHSDGSYEEAIRRGVVRNNYSEWRSYS